VQALFKEHGRERHSRTPLAESLKGLEINNQSANGVRRMFPDVLFVLSSGLR
jgi:hypothetical protein